MSIQQINFTIKQRGKNSKNRELNIKGVKLDSNLVTEKKCHTLALKLMLKLCVSTIQIKQYCNVRECTRAIC